MSNTELQFRHRFQVIQSNLIKMSTPMKEQTTFSVMQLNMQAKVSNITT